MTTISSLSISKHHMLSFLCFILTFDAAANSPAYDFNSYMPTLKQHHSLPENDPAHTAIDSGYTISFDKIAVGIDGQPIGDYDFVYQQRTLDNRAIPVYYKVSHTFLGKDTLGRIVNNAERSEING